MTGSVLAGLALDTTVEGVAESTEEVTQYLAAILSRLGFPDVAQGSLRVSIVNGTVTTVTTVTSVSQMSGFSTAYDQYGQMMAGASAIRNQIVVS